MQHNSTRQAVLAQDIKPVHITILQQLCRGQLSLSTLTSTAAFSLQRGSNTLLQHIMTTRHPHQRHKLTNSRTFVSLTTCCSALQLFPRIEIDTKTTTHGLQIQPTNIRIMTTGRVCTHVDQRHGHRGYYCSNTAAKPCHSTHQCKVNSISASFALGQPLHSMDKNP